MTTSSQQKLVEKLVTIEKSSSPTMLVFENYMLFIHLTEVNMEIIAPQKYIIIIKHSILTFTYLYSEMF